MKKLFLISVLFMLFTLPLFAQDSLASVTAVTTFNDDDIIPLQIKVSNKYTWRKITGANLYASLLADANTWSAANTFNSSHTYTKSIHPVANDTWALGGNTIRYLYSIVKFSYAEQFYITDPGGSDSSDAAKFTYDGTSLTSDKPMIIPGLNMSDDLSFDSSKVMKNVTLGVYVYAIGNVADSVLTLQDTCATVKFSLPGNVTNMEKIEFASGQGLGEGTIIRLVNVSTSEVITLIDTATDGNLRLAGNFAMAAFDWIDLQYLLDEDTEFVWVQCGRSDN